MKRPYLSPAVSRKGIEHFDACPLEAAHVARDYRQVNFGTAMSSVVSVRSIGLNQPLTGQASSSLTSPWFRRRVLRF